MANPEELNFKIHIEQNYITDPNAVIRYNPAWGGTYSGNFSWATLSWDAQTDKHLLGYNVYFSAFPLIKHKANTTIITDANFQFGLPLYPQNIMFYFWVSKVVQSGDTQVETILNDNDEGQTIYTSAQEETFTENTIETNSQFYDTSNIFEDFELILQRIKDDRKMAVQMMGVKCDIFMRRWGSQEPFGTPCACTEDKTDADFMGSTRCPICFGTGVVGGYYPPMETFIRFPAQPAKDFKGSIRGLTIEQTYDGWGLTPPFLRAGDLVVRKIDGQRWIIDQIQLTTFRGAAITQLYKLNLIQQTDIRMLVSLDNINKALALLDDPRYKTPNRENF